MIFINETTYSKQTLDQLTRIAGKSVRRSQVLLYRMLCLVMGAGGLYLGFTYPFDSPVVNSLLQVYGLVFAIAALFWYQVQGLANVNLKVQGPQLRRMQFTEEGFSSTEKSGEHHFAYSAVTALVQTDTQIVLFFDLKQGLLLDKNGFVQGTEAEFITFIQEKTGLVADRV